MFEAWAFVNAPLCRRAKEWGIKMGQEPGIPFEYDRVIDVWTANNIYLAHNQYGLWSQGWVSNVRIRNVRPQHKSPIAWVVTLPAFLLGLTGGSLVRTDLRVYQSEEPDPRADDVRLAYRRRHVTSRRERSANTAADCLPWTYIALTKAC